VTGPRVLTVGSPPTFRGDVAAALDLPAESIPWVQSPLEAVSFLDRATTDPDALVISAGLSDNDALELATEMSGRNPTTAIVLVRTQNPNGHLPAFVRAGVRDIIDVESGPKELKEALRRALAWSRSVQGSRSSANDASHGPQGMVITAFSSKGGAGKSFLATNLAASLAQMGHETGLVDLDFVMGDVFSYFGAEPPRPLQDLLALGDKADIKTMEAMGAPLMEHLWAFGSPPDIAAEKIPSATIVASLQAMKRSFKYTVIDVPAGYGEEVLAALDVSDFVCLIAGLDVVGVKHLAKALETLAYIGIPQNRLMVVLNRADSKVGLEPKDVERLMNIKIDTMIPSSRMVPAALNRGRPVVLEEPKAPVSQAVRSLADKLAAIPLEGSSGSATPARKKRFAFGKA
jgi:pilus assembly protein CpaE